MDEYVITITGSLRGCAVQITDPTDNDRIVFEANDLADIEAVAVSETWIKDNVL